MKKYFFYNVLLTVALIVMVLSIVAAYNSGQHIILAVSVLITVVLIFLKYHLLKQVKRQTKK
ncbi:DUF6358 family protein [Parapedobacter lycopersici]|uniref:DUF6358 family protein n=1 Tax=Parapedobacter lycopersici TaxID=1864939 RepID=UPI0033428F36